MFPVGMVSFKRDETFLAAILSIRLDTIGSKYSVLYLLKHSTAFLIDLQEKTYFIWTLTFDEYHRKFVSKSRE